MAEDRLPQVGDRVRILGAPKGDEWLVNDDHVRIGDEGEVTETDMTDPPIGVSIPRIHDSWWFYAENLEVIA